MMKSLLVTVATLSVLSASAQMNNPDVGGLFQSPQVSNVRSQALRQEMRQASDAELFQKAPKRQDRSITCRYVRPAGAYTGFSMFKDGYYGGEYSVPFIMLKPFVPYTYKAVTDGLDDSCGLAWRYQLWTDNQDGGRSQQWFNVYRRNTLDVQYRIEYDEVPKLYVIKDDEVVSSYQMGWSKKFVNEDDPIYGDFSPCTVLAYPTFAEACGEDGNDLLLSSKTFFYADDENGHCYRSLYYSGLVPWGSNQAGWWFGKNGGLVNGGCIDGIAQAFEKPTSPYLLRQVVLETAYLAVAAPVEMTCKVYRLADGIPAYDSEKSVALPEEPGELIAIGHATVTPETSVDGDGFIVFTLYGDDDGLEYEMTPTIDDAILIAIDGYNDADMENLLDFTALISADVTADEGYGELAYIKYGAPDEDGNFSGDYVWAGLNNFFSSGEMKTGFTIFMIADFPYLAFNRPDIEDGEYIFGTEGGVLQRQDGDTTITGIEFKAWTPSEDDDWEMTCNGSEIPDWLEIELIDGQEYGEFNNIVTAQVRAEPLPDGVSYREAIVRFSFHGAYIDYKFIQGEKVGPVIPPFDEVTIAVVNATLDLALRGLYDPRYDYNGDGEITIADVNEFVNYLLTH